MSNLERSTSLDDKFSMGAFNLLPFKTENGCFNEHEKCADPSVQFQVTKARYATLF